MAVARLPPARITLLAGILALLVSRTEGQLACNEQATTCSECVDSGPDCAWCAAPVNYTVRCMTAARWAAGSAQPCSTVDTQTGNPDLQNPQTSNAPVQPVEALSEFVQVSPRRFRVRLRPGASESVTFNVRPAPNYPLDVYYLMDLSASMFDDLGTLRSQSVSLADALNGVSTNSYLGFGSFVEKPVEPYSIARGPLALIPCTNCSLPYSFRNVVPLTKDRLEFTRRLDTVQVSANIDDPEDSLTALVQAATCDSAVGWQQKSRKVVVVASDAGYHIAGEGRLAGIIRPHDGRCHLVDSTTYSENASRTLDYPSIALVRKVLEENRVITIFAVTEFAVPMYRALSERLPGSSVLVLSSDSQNAVTILREELARQISVTNLTALPHNGGVTISATATCPVTPMEIGPHKLPLCRNMSTSVQAEFTVTLTGTTCEKLNSIGEVVMRVQGFDDVTIEIESLCSCPCENHVDPDAQYCSNAGNETCGSCNCYPGYRSVSGGQCNCNETLGTQPCMTADNQICNGRGTCECMKCVCNQEEGIKICGEFCECDDQSCPTHEGKICGGPTRGNCECSGVSCGQCECLPGYNGTSCECPLSQDTCKQEGDDRVCSGEGVCECGECNCKNGFFGRYCQVCTRQDGCTDICTRAQPCIECETRDAEDRCAPCNEQLRQDATDVNTGTGYTIDGKAATACQQTCDSRYYAAQDDSGNLLPIHIDRNENTCPTSVNYVPIIIGIIIGMLLLGILALILWKLWARWRDRKEYQDFLKNRNKQEWEQDESPLFHPAVVKYVNPQYKIKSEQADGEGAAPQETDTQNF
ncbi:integrin beta-6-like [Sycon ciliatum]|uniref:integrin beta-6-like n=1 Tax=Sycon ciliatum TaxID=27933 RepID=UPI0031F717CD